MIQFAAVHQRSPNGTTAVHDPLRGSLRGLSDVLFTIPSTKGPEDMAGAYAKQRGLAT